MKAFGEHCAGASARRLQPHRGREAGGRAVLVEQFARASGRHDHRHLPRQTERMQRQCALGAVTQAGGECLCQRGFAHADGGLHEACNRRDRTDQTDRAGQRGKLPGPGRLARRAVPGRHARVDRQGRCERAADCSQIVTGRDRARNAHVVESERIEHLAPQRGIERQAEPACQHEGEQPVAEVRILEALAASVAGLPVAQKGVQPRLVIARIGVAEFGRFEVERQPRQPRAVRRQVDQAQRLARRVAQAQACRQEVLDRVVEGVTLLQDAVGKQQRDEGFGQRAELEQGRLIDGHRAAVPRHAGGVQARTVGPHDRCGQADAIAGDSLLQGAIDDVVRRSRRPTARHPGCRRGRDQQRASARYPDATVVHRRIVAADRRSGELRTNHNRAWPWGGP